MDIAEFLKKSLVIIVAGVVTLLASVLLLWLVSGWNKHYDKLKDDVSALAGEEQEIRRAPSKLSPANQLAARTNGERADVLVNDLTTELQNAFIAPDYTRENLSPIKLKEQLNSKCGVLGRQLAGRGVQFPASLSNFTFDAYVAAEYLANPNDIPLIRKHLDIVDELVQRVAASEIKSLDALVRRDGGLALQSSDLYDWSRYSIQATGDIVQVQKLINSLTNSRMCFIIQQVMISTPDRTKSLSYPNPAEPTPTPGSTNDGMMPGPDGMMPGPGGMMPGPGAGKGAPTVKPPTPAAAKGEKQLLPIGQRIAFLELATLKVSLQVDYVEFKRLVIDGNK